MGFFIPMTPGGVMNDDTPHGVVLKPMQQRFVDEYLIDLNATQAAIRAGYSEKTAYSQGQRLLKNVEIDKVVRLRVGDRVERTEVDQDYVIKTIVETIERCSQAKPVYDKSGELVMMETPDGELAPVYKYDATNVLKGAELLGRHLVMFTDKSEISGGMAISTISDLMDDLSNDETIR